MRTKEKEKDKLDKQQAERQKVIEHLEKDVEELRRLSGDGNEEAELERIRQQVAELRREFYTHLGPWQRAQIARHQQRPYTLDYVNYLFTDFMELHGDRLIPSVRPHGRLVAVARHAQRHDRERRQRGVPVEHTDQRVLQHRAVVDARTDDDLSMNRDTMVEQRREPTQ